MVSLRGDTMYQQNTETPPGIKETNYMHGYTKGYAHGWRDLQRLILADLRKISEEQGQFDPDLDVLIHNVIHRVEKSCG